MNQKTKNAGIALGAVVVGAFLVFNVQLSNGQTIKITDDGVAPVDVQKVVVKTTVTKEVTTVDFEGTLSDMVNEILPNLRAQRSKIDADIARYEALRDKVQTEVNKLPARSEPGAVQPDEPVTDPE